MESLDRLEAYVDLCHILSARNQGECSFVRELVMNASPAALKGLSKGVALFQPSSLRRLYLHSYDSQGHSELLSDLFRTYYPDCSE